jgi:tripartite-type tricarboxylate transporter receptor subunit TctC
MSGYTLCIIAAAALASLAAPTHAQTFPAKPIRIVVPLAAGGPGDVLARAVAQKLTENVGQQVVVENRPGANTNIGNEAVAKSPPDGYTLLATASTLTINPALYANLTYDAVKSFAPVTLIAWTPLVLVVHPSLPAKSVAELAALAKAKPAQIYYGSAGSGSVLHLAGEMFNTMARVKLVHVPYKGVTNAFSDLLGGQISLMFPGAPIALPQARAGKLRALATTGEKRAPAAPELPTIAEAGFPGYEVSVWYGLLAPAGTPQATVNRLNSEIVRVVQLPEVRERWAALGAEPLTNTPEQFAEFLKTDLSKWAKVVRDSGAKVD